jgi:hypothetical protein
LSDGMLIKLKLFIRARCNWLDQQLGLGAKVILFLCFVQQYPQSLVLGAIFSLINALHEQSGSIDLQTYISVVGFMNPVAATFRRIARCGEHDNR